MAEDKKDEEQDVETASPKKKKLIFIIVAFFILLIIGVGGYMGAAYFMQLPPFAPTGPSPEEIAAQKAEEEHQEKLLQRDIYVSFDKTFTFTIKSDRRMHTGQVDVVLVVTGEENSELCKKHLPLINSVIFDELSAQSYESLLLPSGRQRLKRELLDAVRAKLTEVVKSPLVEQVLFTSFVLQ